jgi:hypothetical protein
MLQLMLAEALPQTIGSTSNLFEPCRLRSRAIEIIGKYAGDYAVSSRMYKPQLPPPVHPLAAGVSKGPGSS